MRLQRAFRRRLLQRERVILVREEPEKPLVLCFGDVHVPADGEIDDGGREVAHVRPAIDQRAELGGRHLLRRFVPRRDRRQLRIAASRPPQLQHSEEYERGNGERQVAVEHIPCPFERGGPVHDSGIPADHDSDPFAKPEPLSGRLDRAFGIDKCGRLFCRPVCAAKGGRSHTGHTFRQPYLCGGGLDRRFPFVARHVPVELVVLIEEAKAVRNPVAQLDRPRRVRRARHIDLQLPVVTLPADFVPQLAPFGIRDRLDIETERVVQALGRVVLNRNRPVDPVPRSGEPRNDDLLDDDRSVSGHLDDRVEALDDERALGVGRPCATEQQRNPQQRTHRES
jgi:hypothetical protein